MERTSRGDAASTFAHVPACKAGSYRSTSRIGSRPVSEASDHGHTARLDDLHRAPAQPLPPSTTRLAALQTEVTDAAEKLERLYKVVEDGITDLDLLKERLASLKLDRDRAQAALDRVKS